MKNAEKLNAVKGVQVYIMTHAWQDPNGYPGGGIHERAEKLALSLIHISEPTRPY